MTVTPKEGEDRASRRPAAWIVSAVLVGLLVLFVSSWTQGACYDSLDPALSYCESGPVIGIAGTWSAWIGWGIFAGYCVYRATRRTR